MLMRHGGLPDSKFPTDLLQHCDGSCILLQKAKTAHSGHQRRYLTHCCQPHFCCLHLVDPHWAFCTFITKSATTFPRNVTLAVTTMQGLSWPGLAMHPQSGSQTTLPDNAAQA